MSDLLKINVNEHTEKKNGLTYLSWAWAWAEVLKIDPEADWWAMDFSAPDQPCQYLTKMDDGTALVGVTVRLKGKERRCMLPVMDHKNKAIPKPNAFDVNKAQMRCLAKAIAMHGLGLYIYAGEDLPEGEDKPDDDAPPADEESDLSLQLIASIEKVKAGKAPRTIGMKVRQKIQEHLAAGRELGALQEWQDLHKLDNGEEIASIVWGGLTTPERDEIRRLNDAAAKKETA